MADQPGIRVSGEGAREMTDDTLTGFRAAKEMYAEFRSLIDSSDLERIDLELEIRRIERRYLNLATTETREAALRRFDDLITGGFDG